MMVHRDRFAVVVDNKRILLWDGIETQLDKANAEIELKERKIADMIEAENEILVVFECGKIQSLNFVLSSNFREEDDDDEDAEILGGNEFIFKTFLAQNDKIAHWIKNKKNKTAEKVVFYKMKIDPENGSKISLTRIRTFSPKKNCFVMGLLKRNSVLSVSLAGDLYLDEAESALLTLNSVKRNENVRMEALDDDGHAVIVGQGAEAEKCVVSVVNAAIGSVISDKELDLKVQNISVSGSKLFLAHSAGVSMLTVDHLPSNLDDMLGMGVDKDTELYEKIPRILALEDVAEMESVLTDYSDIPELLLIGLIEFLLNAEDEKFKAKSRSRRRSSSGGSDARVKRERLLLRALNVPVTESLTLQYLPKLSLESTVKLLSFLHVALKVESDSDNLVLWVSIAVNSHYSTLVMSKREDISELLTGLSETVDRMEKNSSLCGLLTPFVKMVMEGKCRTDSNNHNREYCIEVVNF